MKTKKQKIIGIILIVFLLMGIGITLTKGLNWSLNYGPTDIIQMSLENDFENQDIKNIVEEVIQDKAIVQKVEIFGTTVLIKAKTITEEQIDSILAKINEKYELEKTRDDIIVGKISNYRGRDIIQPYIVPMSISIGIIAIYIIIRCRKNNIIKLIMEFIGELVITVLIVLSAYAIFRIPVNSLTMPITLIAITTYILLSIRKMESIPEKIK